MIHVGIDPGLSGGIGAIDDSGRVIEVLPAPVLHNGKGEEMDLAAMRDILSKLRDHAMSRGLDSGIRARIEKAQAMTKKGITQGVSSAFKFGKGYGEWRGILAGLEIPFQTVTPQAWKKLILAGSTKEKEASIAKASELFPGANLLPTPKCRKPSHGMAEALLMAEFCRRMG